MKNKLNRLSTFFIIIFFIALSLANIFISKFYFLPSEENINSLSGKIEIEDEEIHLSSYIISKKPNQNPIQTIRSKSGEEYYIYPDIEMFSSFIIYLIFSNLILLSFLLIIEERLRKKRLRTVLEPIENMNTLIEGILSGDSKVADPDKVFDKLTSVYDGDKKKTLENTLKKLIEAEKSRREFTANVTHELKTPLTSINGYAEMIASGLVKDGDVEKFSNIILSEGNRLLQMINEILQLSKYDSGYKDKMKKEELDLSEVAEEVTEDMIHYAKIEEINLSFEGEKALLNADRKMMYELATNLISNAIKYNLKGGSVYVKVKNKERSVTLSVADTGIGIKKEDQRRIFERFYMVNRSSNGTMGTGLGLSLVKYIVLNHNGSIDLKSEIGKGSTFIVELPKFVQ
ncbi:HAMP domain-containing sensor histidine kinase [Citroniella saccharovorans]|uniref:histidine kinase n=1 Tax=Citroniella saccharovorans TaxID=2053367 RepID=A0AAW9MWR6_9FIRM|nr:HAMP domain-containing sensor histidine kinase [Citroniella saccharovorans]MEB3430203.1 HAMP domain-containing sensor histidine kinase [Citroniella saccharovorans]